MTQVFNDAGQVHAATTLTGLPMTLAQIKTAEKDGYEAAQYGFGTQKEKNLAKAQKGHMKDLGSFAGLQEVRLVPEGAARGDIIDVTVFEPGDTVTVSAISKGKGFQGVVKRHGFAGGPRTHGNKHTERAPGSIGVGGVQRVFKGKRMAGRMGGVRVTVKNLRVLQVNKDTNTLVLSGALPGRPGTLVEIRG